MRGTTAPRLHLELMCARVLLPGADVDERGVHARLDRLERRLGGAGLGQADVVGGPAAPTGAPPSPATPAGPAPSASAAPARPAPPTATAPEPGPAAPPPHATPPDSLADAEPADLRGPAGGDSDDTALGAGKGAEAPPAATEPATGQPPQLTVTDVRRLWAEVLEEVKGKRRFTRILLSQNAQVAELRNGTMVLAMANVGARDSFSRGGSEDVLREALVVVLGADFRIETMVEGGPSAPPPAIRPAPVDQQAAASWDAPAPPAPAAEPPPVATEPVRDEAREQLRQQIRPMRHGPAAVGADDERDAAATRHDSDLEETTESHTELLARHLGAEIIAEEEERA